MAGRDWADAEGSGAEAMDWLATPDSRRGVAAGKAAMICEIDTTAHRPGQLLSRVAEGGRAAVPDA